MFLAGIRVPNSKFCTFSDQTDSLLFFGYNQIKTFLNKNNQNRNNIKHNYEKQNIHVIIIIIIINLKRFI